MRPFHLLLPFLIAAPAVAQPVTVDMGSCQFSNGVHPTFDVRFEGTDARTVEAFWKTELKAISTAVTNKKELIGVAARIPAVSPDTLRLLVKAEQPKGTTTVTAHVAILTTNGFVGPDAPERELTASQAYVQQRSVALQRQLAQAALEKGERDLGRLKGELDMLVREKARAENTIAKTKEKDEQAAKDKEATDQELAKLGPELEAMQQEQAATPTEEGAKELKGRQKDQVKLQDRSRRLAESSVSAKKKVTDLEWRIKKNLEDQALKQQAVEKQQGVVEELRNKLASIR